MPNLPLGALTGPPLTRAQIAARCGHLPRFFGYKDVADIVFDSDVEALLNALAYGDLPPVVETACLETLQPRTVETHLLRCLLREIRGLRQDLASVPPVQAPGT